MTRYACLYSNPKALSHALFYLILLFGAAGAAESTATSLPPSTGVTLPSTTVASTSSSLPQTAYSKISISPETCRSASVNPITNRLPQQCWTGSTSATAIGDKSGSKSTIHGSNLASTEIAASSETLPIGNVESTLESRTATDHRAEVPDHATATTVSTSSSSAIASETPESESESPLDNAKFLSFEEWKKENLALAGQGADGLANERKSFTQDRQRPGINNALDGLGDDSEIAFNFNPFGGSGSLSQQPNEPSPASPTVKATGSSSSIVADAPRKRSKDAGKTCKERSNHASFDCAANVLKTNPRCKSSSSILVENKDSYMLNECSMENKFLIVELCENVLIDTVVLANFEFFSSMFRTFRISGSDHYPPKPDQWEPLGTFEARNSREIQAFLVENPRYARYLRVEFLTHYGSEYYCPVSLLRVHGMTMYEEYLRDQQGRENEDEEETSNAEASSKASHDTITVVSEIREDHVISTAIPGIDKQSDLPNDSLPTPANDLAPGPNTPTATALKDQCLSTASPGPKYITATTPEKCAADSDPQTSVSKEDFASSRLTSTTSTKTASKITELVTPSLNHTTTTQSPNISLTASSSNSSVNISSNATATTARPSKKTEGQFVSVPASSPTTLTATQNNLQPAPPSPPTYQPPTQESFFKSIHKRLQALEANATLSLQYIESQSALLRDAFAKVEKRQLGKTSTFLETLNNTIANELARFKNDYDRLSQSAVMELASQREENRRERELLGDRIRVLAEEAVNQKRLMAAQATLLLLCLGLVIFGKLGSGVVPTVDSGLLQGMQEIVMKAKQAKMEEHEKASQSWKWDSPWSSPSRSFKNTSRSARKGDEQKETRRRFNQHGRGHRADTPSPTQSHNTDDGRRLSPLHQTTLQGANILSVQSAPTTPAA